MWREAGVNGVWRKFLETLEWREERRVLQAYKAGGRKRAVKCDEIFQLSESVRQSPLLGEVWGRKWGFENRSQRTDTEQKLR